VLWFENNATHGCLVEPSFPGQDEVIGNALDLGQVASFYTKHILKSALFVSLGIFSSDTREIETDIGTPGERVGVMKVVKVEDSIGLVVNL
jgi:hypothetical protein